MRKIICHIVIPALAPAAFFTIAAIPVEVIGCRNRGLLALFIVFVALVGAVATTAIGTRKRARGEPDHRWWALTTFVLTIPAIALLFLA